MKLIFDEGSQGRKVLSILVKVLTFMGFEDAGDVFESGVIHQIAEALATDMPCADMLMTVPVATSGVLTVV